MIKGTFILIIAVLILATFFFTRHVKIVSGKVIDCVDGTPVSGVEVWAEQRGWGFNNKRLVWDRDYVSKTVSDQKGNFSLSFTVGSSAHLKTRKEGFINAVQFEYPKSDAVVRVKRGASTDVTHNCKLSNECLVTTIENGVTVARDTCGN